MTTDAPRSDSPLEPYYGFRFPETDGDVTMMDRVSPYPPEFIDQEFGEVDRIHINKMLSEGGTPDRILGTFILSARPAAARYLVQQGEVLRSEFRSEEEAEAFWAHVREDAAIERAGISGFDMAQVPDPCCCRIHAGGNRCPDCPQHTRIWE